MDYNINKTDYGLDDLNKILRKTGVYFTMSNCASQPLTEIICELYKRYMQMEEERKGSISLVLFVFIELIQNLINYTDVLRNGTNFEEISKSTMISIGKNDISHFIFVENLIENSQAQILSQLLENLKSISHEDLDALYMKKLKSEDINFKTSGVGLIQIIRKTINYSYNIEKYNDKFSVFNQIVIIV